MAPVMDLEAGSERAPEISERHRILIVAAVSALAGDHFRILEINPLNKSGRNGREKFRPFMEEAARAGNRPAGRARAQGAAA
jgi:hypothetical protein